MSAPTTTKPVILALDDDVNVLRAVERDLRKQYGTSYRISRADSGDQALELLQAMKLRGNPAALFLVDQRMPRMSGVEFLSKAIEIYPDAKRVMLTAYADTDAAIKAINEAHIDHYLLKPWDPPEEKLFPVLEDLLADWHAAYLPPFEGIRAVGNPWSPSSHRVKDFLARNNVPYLWLDPERSEDARQLLEIAAAAEGAPIPLPCLFFNDGSRLSNPSNHEIAERVGLQTRADKPFYDLVVVGAGPAGLAAAVYGASEGLHTLMVEQEAAGGQAGMSSRIENYLGFPSGVSGGELARRAVTQARRFGVEILTAQEVCGLVADGPSRTLKLSDGREISSRVILIATGVSYRQLDAPGIAQLTGAGVYYGAAMSEGESVRGKEIFLIGGANSAGQAGMYFSRFASKVVMVVRGESLASSMSHYLIQQIEATPNIEVWTRSEVMEAKGAERLESLVISREKGAEIQTVPASALFIFIGAAPNTDWLGEAVARDPHGFVLSGLEIMETSKALPYKQQGRLPFMLETSLPGIFVAGDVRSGSVKRVASAVGEGAMSVMYVHRYLALA
jgi:thioredoxin reductase (NADPH)